MPSRAFYSSVLVTVTLFGLLNVGVAVLGRNSIPRQIASRIETTRGLNCLALGNSLMEAGFHPPTFEAASKSRNRNAIIAVNAGMGSSYPVEHMLFLRRAFQKRKDLECVIYGFFDFQLMDQPRTKIGELIGNRAMLYYFEPNIVPRYYEWGLLERLEFHAARMFPAIEERGAIWAKVEKFRRLLSGIGMPREDTNRFGRTADFTLLEASDASQFARDCDRAIDSRRELSKPIEAMVALARQHGARISMIEMPMSPAHVARFYNTPAWRRYRTYLRDLLASHGAEYVVASDWITDERLFEDHLHLGAAGAIAFSQKLGQNLARAAFTSHEVSKASTQPANRLAN